MTNDVRDILARAAHSPSAPVDYAAIAQAASKRRSRRAAAVSLSVVGTLAVAVAATSTLLTDQSAPPAIAPAGTAQSSTDATPFVSNELQMSPKVDGESHRFDVTLPDGASIVVTAAASAGLNQLPAKPYGAVRQPGGGERDLLVPTGGLAWFAEVATKERDVLTSPTKSVSLWSMDDESAGPKRYLVFDFGRWVVGVWDDAGGARMSDKELQTWAQALNTETTDAGFLVLRPAPPLVLVDTGPGAPALRFGEPATDRLDIRSDLCQGTLTPDSAPGSTSASLCQPDWPAHVTVQGDPAFVERVTSSLSLQQQ